MYTGKTKYFHRCQTKETEIDSTDGEGGRHRGDSNVRPNTERSSYKSNNANDLGLDTGSWAYEKISC